MLAILPRRSRLGWRWVGLLLVVVAVVLAAWRWWPRVQGLATRVTPAGPLPYLITQERLSAYPVDPKGSYWASTDLQHYGFVTPTPTGRRLVCDGQLGPRWVGYYEHAPTEPYVAKGERFLHPEHGPSCYVLHETSPPNSYRMVVDGQASEPYDELTAPSPHSDTMLLAGRRGTQWQLVRPGYAGPWGGPFLCARLVTPAPGQRPSLWSAASDDGRHAAVMRACAAGWLLLMDDQPVALAAQTSAHEWPSCTEQPGLPAPPMAADPDAPVPAVPRYDLIGDVFFAAGGGPCVFAARQDDGHWVMVRDGVPGEPYDGLAFTNRGPRRACYIGYRQGAARIVNGDHAGPWWHHAELAYGARYGACPENSATSAAHGTDWVNLPPAVQAAPLFVVSADGARWQVQVQDRLLSAFAPATSDTVMQTARVVTAGQPPHLLARGQLASGQWAIQHDDHVGPPAAAIGRYLLSRDGHHWAYVAGEQAPSPAAAPGGDLLALEQHSGPLRVYLDDQPGDRYDEIGALTLSTDGRQLAYTARQGRTWYLVLHGQRRWELPPPTRRTGGSPSTQPLDNAPVMENYPDDFEHDSGWAWLHHGPDRTGEGVFFAADNQRLYARGASSPQLLVYAPGESRPVTEVTDFFGELYLPPQGHRFGYSRYYWQVPPDPYRTTHHWPAEAMAMSTVYDDWQVVVDGQPDLPASVTHEYHQDETADATVLWSPDCRHVAVWSRWNTGPQWSYVTVDQQAGPTLRYPGKYAPLRFLPDGAAQYVAVQQDGYLYRITHHPPAP